jgi:hypothetical protein
MSFALRLGPTAAWLPKRKGGVNSGDGRSDEADRLHQGGAEQVERFAATGDRIGHAEPQIGDLLVMLGGSGSILLRTAPHDAKIFA